MIQADSHLDTPGRGIHAITGCVAKVVTEGFANASPSVGLCHLFICPTHASLLITENADPDVHRDLETFIVDLAPDGDQRFVVTARGI